MKITLGKEIEEVKKQKDSENEKNLLKNRNSEDINELDENEDDVYFHSNAVKNIKLGTQLVNRIYLNNNIIYDIKDTILLYRFHSLVPNTATEIRFLYSDNNLDLTDYQKLGYCDNNNFIEVWESGTKYILINPRKNYIYSPTDIQSLFYSFNDLTICICKNFDTENTTIMRGVFAGCSKLETVDLSSFNTQKVTDMAYMFFDCFNIKTIKAYTFNTAALTTPSTSMFNSCVKLVGGNGTTYSSSHNTAEYARVDGENGLPGYFTAPPANNK